MVAERRVKELDIVDLDIAKARQALGKNWHFEPSNGSWLLKSKEGENGAGIS